MPKYLLILIIFVFFVLGSVIFPVREDDSDQEELRSRMGGRDEVYRSSDEQRTIDVYKETNEAVVFISTVTLTIDPFDWFPEIEPQKGSGSGVIVDAKQGIILTNLHVISDAHQIKIILFDGQSYAAKLLGFDKDYDLAVLKLLKPPEGLIDLKFGDSSTLEVGQNVLAIGNPFGLNRTLTTGIISSLDRTVQRSKGNLLKGLVQTDAAINPGNSGGPLLDFEGRMIGLNTAILSQSGDSAGIGFAVPINKIKKVLPELIATGKVLRPSLAWVLVDTNQGPMVRRVMNEGPAHKAGIQPIERYVQNGFVRAYVRDYDSADLILEVDGVAVKNKEDIEDIVHASDPKVGIEIVLRQGGLNGPERTVKINPVLQ